MRATDGAPLGRDGLSATVLGLGGGPLGGLFEPVPAPQAEETVESAWDLGLRLFDVAPLYGNGRSERVLGKVLGARPRSSFVLSTKVGRLLRPTAAESSDFAEPSNFVQTDGVGPVRDYSADGVTRSLAESLERLGLDQVDIVYIHDPEPQLEQALTEAYPALAALRDSGVVTSIGVGTNQASTVARFALETGIDCVLLASRLTLLDQSALVEALPRCRERGVSVVVGGVFNSGILAGGAAEPRFDYRPAPPALVERAAVLADVCAEHGVPLAAAALQYPLRHAGVDAVLTGARSAAELEANVSAFELAIPDALWPALEQRGVEAAT